MATVRRDRFELKGESEPTTWTDAQRGELWRLMNELVDSGYPAGWVIKKVKDIMFKSPAEAHAWITVVRGRLTNLNEIFQTLVKKKVQFEKGTPEVIRSNLSFSSQVVSDELVTISPEDIGLSSSDRLERIFRVADEFSLGLCVVENVLLAAVEGDFMEFDKSRNIIFAMKLIKQNGCEEILGMKMIADEEGTFHPRICSFDVLSGGWRDDAIYVFKRE